MTEADKATLKSIQDLSLNLKNRTFVDYFNTFLCLPVFGQHVLYNFMETEFEFEPPIRQRRHLYLDRREVLIWLCTERVSLFKLSPLFTEYNLCMKLRTTDIELPGMKQNEPDGIDRQTFVRNVIGTVMGMQLFRESIRGTNGERVFRCWKDVEAWRVIEDPVRKMYWKRIIKTKYISQNSASDVVGSVKLLVFQGNLNFNLINDDDVGNEQVDKLLGSTEVQCVHSDDALLYMQVILLNALKKYWLPRHIISIMKNTPQETLDILKRPAPGDLEYLEHERRLRCRYTFPTIYDDSNISSPATTVFMSKSAGELPVITPSYNEEEDDMSEDDDEDFVPTHGEPLDLLSLWGGPAKEIKIIRRSSSPSSLSIEDSQDDLLKRKLRSTITSASEYIRSPVPIELTSFLGGKRRTLIGRCPKTSKRIVWSLASDILAACPFRTFLQKNDYPLDLHCLNFWTDVRNYLDVDDNAVNSLGQSLRGVLAHGILRKYLSKDGEACGIFSEFLKMALYNALTTNNDVSLLCIAQDIVQESLWEPLKMYIKDERQRFLKQVRGTRYDLTIKQRHRLDRMSAKNSKPNLTDSLYEDTVYFFNCSTLGPESPSTVSPPDSSPSRPCSSTTSSTATSYHVCISEEQMWKATELAVLCCEYGSAMMIPQYPPKVQQLVDILQSDYGSLHVARVPAVRNEWLRHLMNPPKINIESLQVSRIVHLDKIEISSTKVAKMEESEINVWRPKTKFVMRRNGLVLDRPQKPKSFIEALTGSHFDFFKRFMIVQKMGLPLMFWRAVEDLKNINNSKTRHIRVTQITRKFFGKYAKYGALLDCHEEIIGQIPNMDKVTPGILICAQAAVYRSMERKWFPLYIETYPPESCSSSLTNLATSLIPQNVTPELLEVMNQMKKPKRKQTGNNTKIMRQWRNITGTLCEFTRALSSRHDVQLLEIFMKCEVEKEQYTALTKETGHSGLHPIEKNTLMSNLANNTQTRVVIRNRLVILNRLPSDLRFWIEVKKFQDLVDSANLKGDISAQDTEFLSDKARSVISCFLASDVPPKVQVNIPNDMAFAIVNSLSATGPVRGLFHDAIFLLFPVLYHYYRKFQDEVINGDVPDEYLDYIENSFKDRVSSNPHANMSVPDFRTIQETTVKTQHHVTMDENCMKINFSISGGIIYILPVPKAPKSPSYGGKRFTRHSINAVSEESTPRKRESRTQQTHGAGGKDGGNAVKSGDQPDEHQQVAQKPPKSSKLSLPQKPKSRIKREKIIIREAQDSKLLAINIKHKHTSERAKRMSCLVETLNQERQRKINEQNKKHTTMIHFEDVVRAALSNMSNVGSNHLYS